MGMRYRYLNHTADIEYIAYGNNLKTLFKNALLGMFNTIADIKKMHFNAIKSNKIKQDFKKLKAKRVIIRNNSDNKVELLWKILQDALSISDAEQLFFYNIKNIKLGKRQNLFYFSAELLGLNKFEQVSKFDVKGVSMLDMKIKKIKNKFYVRVVLDV
ncbi:MAG: archease [Candidatus Micrarchaeia archaeon]